MASDVPPKPRISSHQVVTVIAACVAAVVGLLNVFTTRNESVAQKEAIAYRFDRIEQQLEKIKAEDMRAKLAQADENCKKAKDEQARCCHNTDAIYSSIEGYNHKKEALGLMTPFPIKDWLR